MIKRIHVNQHVIRANQKNGGAEPPIRIKCAGRNIAATDVMIQGPSQLLYRPTKPLSCGARLWIETEAPLVADGILIR
jgi:hypothetical protein